MAKTSSSSASKIILGVGILMCLWVVASLISGLAASGWSVGEMAGQYMTAIGMIKPLHTLVDYYTHIKGIEYLICVAFFVAFPVFFKYVNKSPKEATASK